MKEMGSERKGNETGTEWGWNVYGAEAHIFNIRHRRSDASLLTPIRNKHASGGRGGAHTRIKEESP